MLKISGPNDNLLARGRGFCSAIHDGSLPLFRHFVKDATPYPSVRRVHEQIRALSSAGNAENDQDEPIFVLATGWRTGSTLVQRALMTDPELLIWGEPLSAMALLTRITEMMGSVPRHWPPAQFWIDEHSGRPDPVNEWIANLFPPRASLRAALRAMCDELFRAPALARGYRRWGFKEVRLGAAEALVLRWLYPRAHFVVLTRHPVSACTSFKGLPQWEFVRRWPDVTADCATVFARHWNALSASWNGAPPHLDPIMLRYEDFTEASFDFPGLNKRLGLELSPAPVMRSVVGASPDRPGLSTVERWIVLRETRVGRKVMHY